MADIFNTPYWNNKNERDKKILADKHGPEETTLPGWLIGTAGAVRYRLPENLPPSAFAISYVYVYLLGTVTADGSVEFEFELVTEHDVPSSTAKKYGKQFVDFCFLANRDDTVHVPEQSCNER